VQRISVLGTSGSGKTTLARRLAADLDLPHLELDAVFHQPGWTELPLAQFRDTVGAFCAGDRWVVCGKYSQVRDLVLGRADTVVCLDHHRLRQTLRVAWRTALRIVRREDLWNGNRETWRGLAVWRAPEESIVRWTWDNVPSARRLFDEVDQRFAGDPAVDVVRLRGWRQVDAWASAQSKTTVRRP
jgi:adenylate kinase family enzyme